jgi:hypothetical protein
MQKSHQVFRVLNQPSRHDFSCLPADQIIWIVYNELMGTAEAKAYLKAQREALELIERRQFAEDIAKSPEQKLLETLGLCDIATQLWAANHDGRPRVPATRSDRWVRLAQAWNRQRTA